MAGMTGMVGIAAGGIPVFAPDLTLAVAAPAGQGDPVAVVVWVGVLILAVVGAGLAVLFIRRRLLRKHDSQMATSSFLDELRDMHRRGEVSDEEFQAARASLLSKITGTPMPQIPTGPTRLGGAPMPDARVAQPGFDLTGAPLPRPIGERPEPPAPT